MKMARLRSSVAPRRPTPTRRRPWIEVHGYRRGVAPRLGGNVLAQTGQDATLDGRARSSSAGALERNNGRSGNSALPGRGFWWGKRTRAGALGRRGRGERLGWFVPLPDAAPGNGDGAARHPYHRLVAPRLGETLGRLLHGKLQNVIAGGFAALGVDNNNGNPLVAGGGIKGS